MEMRQLQSDDQMLRSLAKNLLAAERSLSSFPAWAAARAAVAEAREHLASRFDALGYVQEAAEMRAGDSPIMLERLKEWATEDGCKTDVRRTEFGELRHGNRHF